jgi:hypothetical protein
MSEEYEKLKKEALAYIGLTLIDAKIQLKKENKTYRIISKDGKQFCGTCEWVVNRINFKIENGVITEVWVG